MCTEKLAKFREVINTYNELYKLYKMNVACLHLQNINYFFNLFGRQYISKSLFILRDNMEFDFYLEWIFSRDNLQVFWKLIIIFNTYIQNKISASDLSSQIRCSGYQIDRFIEEDGILWRPRRTNLRISNFATSWSFKMLSVLKRGRSGRGVWFGQLIFCYMKSFCNSTADDALEKMIS